MGDGKSIKIWEDPWLPRNITKRPMTPRGDCDLVSVAELLDPLSGGWNENLIRQVFWEEDVDLILKIPVHMVLSDFLAWHPDVKGLFSVKSAYHVAVDHEDRESSTGGGGSTSEQRVMINWCKIWRIPVPNKIKHFLWRLAHNTVAVRANLRRRGMDIDVNCLFCRTKDEDSWHLFFKCKHVKKIWRGVDLDEERQRFAALNSAVEVFEGLLNLTDEKQTPMATVLWNWWLERNKVREGGVARTPDDLTFIIRNQARSFLEIATKPTAALSDDVQSWRKPDEGWVKINVDGSFLPDSEDGGWGAVLRDCSGVVLASGAGNLFNLQSASQAEAMAALQGVKLANVKGHRNVILETDSLFLRSVLLSAESDKSPFAVIIEQIMAFFLSRFFTVRDVVMR